MTIGHVDQTQQLNDPAFANEVNAYFANLTTGNVDHTVTGSGNDVVYGGTGSDTVDASGSTGNVTLFAGTGSENLIGGSGNDTYFTSTGNDTVTGGSGNDTFNVNYIPGFDTGTTNTIGITGGDSGANVANFNDNMSDATISAAAGVTTVDFTAGTNAGQVDTTTNVQTLNFLDGHISG
jgi:Ca2+-binding RTX toxin-like protein